MAAVITISSDNPAVRSTVKIVTISEMDGIYALYCSGSAPEIREECPTDVEPGDTWSDYENCIADATNHIALHEKYSR
jgi:hypothetical protein